MKYIDEIRSKNPALANKIEGQHGYILVEDVEPLIKVNRLMNVLVRCNGGRFLTPIQDLNHFMKIIESQAEMVRAYTGNPLNPNTDWVRDVSLPSS